MIRGYPYFAREKYTSYAYFVEQYSFSREELSCKFTIYSFSTYQSAKDSLQDYIYEALYIPDLQIIDSGVLSYEEEGIVDF